MSDKGRRARKRARALEEYRELARKDARSSYESARIRALAGYIQSGYPLGPIYTITYPMLEVRPYTTRVGPNFFGSTSSLYLLITRGRTKRRHARANHFRALRDGLNNP